MPIQINFQGGGGVLGVSMLAGLRYWVGVRCLHVFLVFLLCIYKTFPTKITNNPVQFQWLIKWHVRTLPLRFFQIKPLTSFESLYSAVPARYMYIILLTKIISSLSVSVCHSVPTSLSRLFNSLENWFETCCVPLYEEEVQIKSSLFLAVLPSRWGKILIFF